MCQLLPFAPARRRACRLTLLTAVGLSVLSFSLLCPLGGSTPATAQGVTAGTEAAPAPPTDVFLLELRRRARGGETQVAESIRDALRVKLDEDAGRFLETLAGRELTDDQRRKMVQIIGGDSLLRATIGDRFSDAAKQQASELLAAKKRFDESPERLAAAIPAMLSDDAELALPATRTLLSGGAASIGPLALAAARETDAVRRDTILRVIARQGDESLEALSALALYGDSVTRPGAILAIERLRPDAAIAFLGVAAHSPGADEAERALGEERLTRRFGKLPTHAEVERFLVDRLEAQRSAAGLLSRSEASGLAWGIDAESGFPTSTPTTATIASQRRVADTTRLMYRLGDLSPETKLAAMTADLAYRYQVDPFGLVEQADEIRQLWGDDALTARSLSSVIGRAIDDDDLGAAVAAMSLVSELIAGDSAALLTTQSGQIAPLVAAIMHSVPQVRYEATLAVARLAYPAPFPGVSNVTTRLSEMATLDRQPLALVVDTRVERESQIERLISSLGYRVEVAASVGDAIRQIDQGGDLRMVITTSLLPDRTVLELVDEVRRHPFGRRIPIFIHGPFDSSIQAATEQTRWVTPVVHLELPTTASGWGAELESVVDQRAGRLQGLEPLTAAQRFDIRRQAIEAIGRLSGSPDRYPFYDFSRLDGASLATQAIAASDLSKVAFGEPRLALLSASATGQSQTTLVDLMLRASSTSANVQATGEALLASLDRHGVLLSGDVIGRLGESMDAAADGPRRDAITGVVRKIASRYGFQLIEAGKD